jgi:hypothetical protein
VARRRLPAPEAVFDTLERLFVSVRAHDKGGRRRRPYLEVHDLLVARDRDGAEHNARRYPRVSGANQHTESGGSVSSAENG